MEAQDVIRAELVDLLTQGNAHMPFEEAVADYPMDHINTPCPNTAYTAWHLLEHIRLAQWDILDFIRNPNYQEREWPGDYWPALGQQATPDGWRRTIEAFLADRAALRAIVEDPETDLYARIPHGTGQTIFREILVVSDHNAYHLGEFANMRQVMGTWGTGHDAG